MDAAYFRSWRADHPEYRRRESERSRLRRLADARGHHGDDRTTEYVRQRERRAEQRAIARGDNGWPDSSHPILDAAREVASRFVRPDRRSTVYTTTYDDAVSEAVLALVAHADPQAAVKAFMQSENAWTWHTAPLFDGLAMAQDRESPA